MMNEATFTVVAMEMVTAGGLLTSITNRGVCHSIISCILYRG
jgi:hypothetical protein